MIQDMNLPDVKYSQTNWEETQEMVQYELLLIGFDDDINLYTSLGSFLHCSINL